jgi:superfamily II DNA helicase RecQ
MALADKIGQHDAQTDGVARVNRYHAGLSDENRRAILSDFSDATSNIRTLFSSNALGMGSDLRALYVILGIDPPIDLEDWIKSSVALLDGSRASRHCVLTPLA